MHSFGRALIGLLILEVAVAQVRATVLLPADLAALVRGSQAVVHGRVVNVRAAWADGRRRIESFVTVEVVEYFKGDLGGRVTIRVPGGQIGRYRSVTVGAPTFREGDEVVLFLNARGPSIPYVLGLSQGVFRVRAATGFSESVVTPSPLLAGSTDERVIRGASSRRPIPLSTFGETVRALVGSRGGVR